MHDLVKEMSSTGDLALALVPRPPSGPPLAHLVMGQGKGQGKGKGKGKPVFNDMTADGLMELITDGNGIDPFEGFALHQRLGDWLGL